MSVMALMRKPNSISKPGLSKDIKPVRRALGISFIHIRDIGRFGAIATFNISCYLMQAAKHQTYATRCINSPRRAITRICHRSQTLFHCAK